MLKSFLKRVLRHKTLPQQLSYEDALKALETHSDDLYRELAVREDAEPEMLYYLAQNSSQDIRECVAANPRTPIQADLILASDGNDDVRMELAKKINRLLPGLAPSEAEKIREQTIETIDTLARDKLPRVRQILAEEIKNSTEVPMEIIKRLAQDLEVIVSAPILEYSPLLGDEDLLEIIASGTASGALEAIAKRKVVSEPVSDAIVATLDIPAVAALLVNPNAQIREDTLDEIIESAEGIDAWHRPLVMRPDLSIRAVRRISGFVASSLITLLLERNNLEGDVLEGLKQRVRQRIQEEESLSSDTAEAAQIAQDEAARAWQEGRLDDTFVREAAEDGNRELVVESLALLTRLAPSLVNRIIESRQGKAITSLAWKAGLSMRVALKVQTFVAHVSPHAMVHARDGVDFPLNEQEMEWHLSYFQRKSRT